MDKNYFAFIWSCLFSLAVSVWSSGEAGGSIDAGGDATSVGHIYTQGVGDSARWGDHRVPKPRASVSDNGDLGGGVSTHDRDEGFDKPINLRDRVSKYISYNEATYSRTARRLGINNDPTEDQLRVMMFIGLVFFDKLREAMGVPLYINSFFRSRELNKAVGGTGESDHLILGDCGAIDIDISGKGPKNNADVFFKIKDSMDFYKLIAEFPVKGDPSWVHVSFCSSNSMNEKKYVFVAIKRSGRTVYLPYKGNEYLVK